MSRTVRERGAGATVRRPGRPSRTAETLTRVRAVLVETVEADGQGFNTQEISRRKAYRAGINRALAEIDALEREAR